MAKRMISRCKVRISALKNSYTRNSLKLLTWVKREYLKTQRRSRELLNIFCFRVFYFSAKIVFKFQVHKKFSDFCLFIQAVRL